MAVEPLLSVRALETAFSIGGRMVPVVEGISFDLAPGETLGIVGESGSGKSVTSLSIMRLIPSPPGRITGGEVLLRGRNLLRLDEAQMRRIRGNEISMIFQEPMTCLNPVFRIGDQIAETIVHHERVGREQARARAIEMLRLVGIPQPAVRIDAYPHELSGGMRQRVMIAIALACNPSVLIADEPTTALDVTIQAQILDLLRLLRREFGMAIVLITHDLGVIAEMADRVVVMYAGKVVETAPVDQLFQAPAHPYTEGLLASIPDLDAEREDLATIEGVVPPPFAMPRGCRFHPRCRYARPPCQERTPDFVEVVPGQRAACIRHLDYCHVTRSEQSAA
jgi:oligopeptide/dipeptide ABC transporter ATP-binding protein